MEGVVRREREGDLVFGFGFGGDGVSIHSATGSAAQPDILRERVALAKSPSGDGPRAHDVRRNRNATEPTFRASFKGRPGIARHSMDETYVSCLFSPFFCIWEVCLAAIHFGRKLN